MLKVAVTGSGGLVGSRIIDLLYNKIEFIPLSQKQMDITHKDSVWQNMKDLSFDTCLHLAAYTNVVGAESDSDTAYRINRDGTKNLFEIVSDKKKNFIYISTDFVFDGTHPPYFEDSSPNPQATYAKSKFEGEIVLQNKALIVRISYPYRAFFDPKRDFFRTFKMLLEQRKPLTMIADSLMTPTFIDDIAYGLLHLFGHFKPGVVHLVGSRAYSPYDIARLIAREFHLDESLIAKISYEEYVKTRARLPQYADIRSKTNNFQYMRSFEEGLGEIRSQLGV